MVAQESAFLTHPLPTTPLLAAEHQKGMVEQ